MLVTQMISTHRKSIENCSGRRPQRRVGGNGWNLKIEVLNLKMGLVLGGRETLYEASLSEKVAGKEKCCKKHHKEGHEEEKHAQRSSIGICLFCF